MSMRTVLFLLFAGVLSVLLITQWWLHQQQSLALADTLAKTTFAVTRDTLSSTLFGSSDNLFLSPNNEVELHLLKDSHGSQLRLITESQDRLIGIDDSALSEQLAATLRQQNLVTLVLMSITLVLLFFLAHAIAKPLQQLRHASEAVAHGHWGQPIANAGYNFDEIAHTIKTFNHMSLQLKRLADENEKHRQSKSVEEFTDIAKGFAHALRNPLNTLGLALNELSSETIEATRRTRLQETANRQIARIDDWIKAMLELSQPGLENTAVHDVALIVQSCAEQWLPDHSIRVVNAEASFALQCKRLELHNMIQALLTNAIEASTENSPIDIQLSRNQDGVVIEIRDWGSGIPKEISAKLFEPHVTTKASGTGMGLYLAKRIATGLYNGDITIDNAEPTGTVARLRLNPRRVS